VTDRASKAGTRPTWMADPDTVAPTVLLLGGFLTSPPVYTRMVRRLRDRGVAGVVVADVWTPDWLLAGVRGTGPLTTRSAKAVLDASRLSGQVSGGAPLLVVGHSAGGVTARLLTAPEPFPGRRFGGASRFGAIVSLGTPHFLANGEGIGQRMEEVAASIADRSVPGAYFDPRIRYVSVASRAVRGDPEGSGKERIAHLLYRSVVGPAAVAGTLGDGLVPVEATELAGAKRLLLDHALHSPGAGGPWYGSDDQVELWWPLALATWREALRHRASEG
jgi:pimeloyl-ACP methyl ester carboxylesterase